MADGTVAKRGSDDLAPVSAENFPALLDGVEGMVEVLSENVGGALRMTDLQRVPIPSGGGTAWEVTDDFTGEESHPTEIEGVLAYWTPARTYWESDEVTGAPPDCSSADGVVPIAGGMFGDGGSRANENLPVTLADGRAVRSCAHCPMSQRGSSGEGTAASACAEKRLLFILREGDTLPTLISAPPTSLAPLRKFLIGFTARKQSHYSSLVLALGLEKVTGGPGGGQKYSVIKPRPVGMLEGWVRGKGKRPDPETPAGMSRAYSEGFAKLLTPEVLVEAAAGPRGSDDEPDDDRFDAVFDGDFGDHGEVADPVGDGEHVTS